MAALSAVPGPVPPALLSGGLPSPAPLSSCEGQPGHEDLTATAAQRRWTSVGPALGAIAVGAAVVGRQRVRQSRKGRRKGPRAQVVRAAAGKEEEDDDPEAALRALEDELEGLEEALGDDLAAEMQERQASLTAKVDEILERAPQPRESTISPSSGPDSNKAVQRVAVCGFLGEGGAGISGVGGRILARLREEGQAEPQMLDLRQLPSMPFEQVDTLLAGCQSAVICPEGGDEGEALAAALAGLKAALPSFPGDLTKVILLSRVGAQDSKGGFNLGSFFGGNQGASWADVEDELTSFARTRSSANPLQVLMLRTGELTALTGSSVAVRCMKASAGSDSPTSMDTAAEAIFQALKLEVDTSLCVVEDPAPSSVAPDWSELMLPFIGPELWRQDVDDAKKAAIFVRGWADEFFGANKSALRQGVKTPVQFENTPSGVIFKFRPLGTLDEVSFEELEFGGVEFVAEEPEGLPPRMRIKRFGYGWKVSVKENSEKALVSKFAKDWEEVS